MIMVVPALTFRPQTSSSAMVGGPIAQAPGVEPHGLVHHRTRVGQGSKVGLDRAKVAEHGGELGVQLGLGLRMLGEQIPWPRSGSWLLYLVAGDEDGDDLVAHLAVAELAPVSSSRAAMRRASRSTRPTSCPDSRREISRPTAASNRAVMPATRFRMAPVAMAARKGTMSSRSVDGVGLADRLVHQAYHLVAVVGEHGARDDLQGELGHLRGHVHVAIGLAAQLLAVGEHGLRHGGRVAGDAAAVEGRGHDAAVGAPDLAFAAQEAVAEGQGEEPPPRRAWDSWRPCPPARA